MWGGDGVSEAGGELRGPKHDEANQLQLRKGSHDNRQRVWRGMGL